ncbi:uncharacterized protein TrAtP1_000415 [Trichoderma atroviride]|uniref:Uncharacterized protein n=1 Tax=Hypocrea atroviridis (strain ATCC 20476 / IMI 206040) TaxID=452589 RepID=G9NJC9_HYPAI|nr:uncharacterized protein TRIATDRAFT_255062 [Trichoderma atroviride IMI 206040]EHK49004.1 hypothetical protein TRIATDRAFT_255062 [Trichoderma atroviride IMI 206040]UKZ59097.1 hypothetical protein TrAtP1_000415 [Trichoderma atroviride]
MSASRQIMKWSPQVHQDILIATFCNLSLSSEQWAKVMADLSKMGYTFSEGALRYVDACILGQWHFTNGCSPMATRPRLIGLHSTPLAPVLHSASWGGEENA